MFLGFTHGVRILAVCRLTLLISSARASTQATSNLINVSIADIAEELAKMSIIGVSQQIVTDVQNGGHKLVEVFQDANGTVLGCNALGSKDLIDSVLEVIPVDMVTEVNQNEMQSFLDLCDSQNHAITQSQTVMLDQSVTLTSIFDFLKTAIKSLLIYPGTKWCGAGDIAKDNNDLGREIETDKCCRDHDNNAGSIGSFEEEHGITNLQIFTMTNCRDDCKFYNCLVNVSTATSDIIGTIFFNALDAHCYAYGYPEDCVRYNAIYIPLLTQDCLEYQPDTSQPEEWRSYAPPNFSGTAQLRNCTQYNETV